jgi:hypothetical protein
MNAKEINDVFKTIDFIQIDITGGRVDFIYDVHRSFKQYCIEKEILITKKEVNRVINILRKNCVKRKEKLLKIASVFE